MIVTFIPGPSKLMKEAKDYVDAGQFECTEEQFKIIKPKLAEIGNSGFKVIR